MPIVRLVAMTVSVTAINVLSGCTMRSAADHQSSTEGSTLVQTGKVINRRDNTVTLRLDDGNERAYGIEADSTVGIGDRVKIITHAGGVRITH